MYHTNITLHLSNEVNQTFDGFKELLRSYNKKS